MPSDHNWEKQQKTVNEELNRAYPPLYVLPKIVRDEHGTEFLAVIVPGSPQRPHFAGKAYIRVGPETKEASEEQFNNLVAQRSSKVYEILKWKGKTVTVDISVRQINTGTSYSQGSWTGTVEDCNKFWVSLLTETKQPVVSSLALVDLSFDPLQNRLRLLLWQT